MSKLLRRRSRRPPALDAADWQALRYLVRANRFSRTPAALARHTGAGSLAAQQLARLVRAGLVQQEAAGVGEIGLALSPAGRDRLRDDPLQAVLEATGGGAEADLPVPLPSAQEGLDPGFGSCPSCHHFAALEAGGGRCRQFRVKLEQEETRQICAMHQSEAAALMAAAARRHRARW